MVKRLAAILFLAFALAAAPAAAQQEPLRDRVIRELRSDGFTEIRVSRTLLGRLRFVAVGPQGRREIVINPVNGVILRDYFNFADDDDDDDDRWGGSGGAGSPGSFNDDDDDYDDDDYDDEDDDDEDDDDDDDEDDDDDDD